MAKRTKINLEPLYDYHNAVKIASCDDFKITMVTKITEGGVPKTDFIVDVKNKDGSTDSTRFDKLGAVIAHLQLRGVYSYPH